MIKKTHNNNKSAKNQNDKRVLFNVVTAAVKYFVIYFFKIVINLRSVIYGIARFTVLISVLLSFYFLPEDNLVLVITCLSRIPI